jgi:tetratricopeptide (TPR) repeat protein
MYNSYRPETLPRAIEAYENAVASSPADQPSRHNLALIYSQLQRFDEAKGHLEELRRRGMRFPDTHALLAQCYLDEGRVDEALAVHQDFLRQNPDSAAGRLNFAEFLLTLGRLEEAEDALERAEAIDPGSLFIKLSRGDILYLRGEFSEAEAAARSIQTSSDPFRRWNGSMTLSNLALARGQRDRAIRELEAATQVFSAPGRFTAGTHRTLADLLLETGDPARAREQARKAREIAVGDWNALWALPTEALAEARLGRWDEAERLEKELEDFARSVPGPALERELDWLRGELSRARGDNERALQELERAVETLPANISTRPPPRHVRMWYSYALALLESGREDEAALWFERITESTTERILWPVHSIRSLYFLGKIYEKRGDGEKARDYYRRFVDHWKDGDMDRERVAEATKKL